MSRSGPDPWLRTPGAVDGLDPGGEPVAGGFDTDCDGVPDTVVTVEGPDLLLHTDLDADGVADVVLRLATDPAEWAPAASDRPFGGWWWPGGGTEPSG